MPFDPISLFVRANRMPAFRWLLGLHNFNLMPPRSGIDPLSRMRDRMASTGYALLAMLIALAAGATGGVCQLLAWPRAAAWSLLCGAIVSGVFAFRGYRRSRRSVMPVPGLAYVSGSLGVLYVVAAILILWSNR